MKIAGFTFIRNAIRFDYPVEESIRSILPLCDFVVVAVGQSEDETLDLVRSIEPGKVRILETQWDDSLRQGGRVLAEETNKAYRAIREKVDWCFYIQADEVVHEEDYDALRQNMEQFKDDPRVEGLVFDYLHFYGSYHYLGDSRRWYRREVRIIRQDPAISSYRDAQGFRKNGKKIRAQHSGGRIFHYGWVKSPERQQQKQRYFNKLWHSDEWVQKNVAPGDTYDYAAHIDSLKPFKGSHPALMQKRIQQANWDFFFEPSMKRLSAKDKLSRFIEQKTGWRIGEFRNYRWNWWKRGNW